MNETKFENDLYKIPFAVLFTYLNFEYLKIYFFMMFMT